MTLKRTMILAVTCAFALILLVSCETVAVHGRAGSRHGAWIGNGPPAHAKAHGYRRKHVCGHELVYDADCGVYVVVGVAGCYYYEGNFYRQFGDGWQIGVEVDGDWGPVAVNLLPPGLWTRARAHARVQTQTASVPKPKAWQGKRPVEKEKEYAKGRH
jgi:hypothetical protein